MSFMGVLVCVPMLGRRHLQRACAPFCSVSWDWCVCDFTSTVWHSRLSLAGSGVDEFKDQEIHDPSLQIQGTSQRAPEEPLNLEVRSLWLYGGGMQLTVRWCFGRFCPRQQKSATSTYLPSFLHFFCFCFVFLFLLRMLCCLLA